MVSKGKKLNMIVNDESSTLNVLAITSDNHFNTKHLFTSGNIQYITKNSVRKYTF